MAAAGLMIEVPTDLDTLWLILLFPAGFVAGMVNVIAGGGSFLTLPVLMAAGLPIHIANGTNRISVILQGLFATASYHRKGEFEFALYKKLLPAVLTGSAAGAVAATLVDPNQLKRVFGVLFLGMAVVLLFRSRFKTKGPRNEHPLRHVAFFVIGVYGGFIQAGVGLWLLLGSTALFGVDAFKANTVKLPLTLTFTFPAFLLFLYADMVSWVPGIILGLGTVFGAFAGVRLTLKGGSTLILRAVTVVLLITGIHLLFR